MRYGDRVQHIVSMLCGRAREFLQDGEVEVDWDNGTHTIVKWINLMPAPSPKKDAEERYKAAHEAIQTAYKAFCLADAPNVNKQSAAALIALVNIAAAVAVDLGMSAERLGGLALSAHMSAVAGAPKWG